MHSLLDDTLFTTRTDMGGRAHHTLPEVLYGLHKGTLDGFDALQPHQEQAWHSFLVQLATLAIERASDGTVPDTPEAWRTALLDLSDGNTAAWHLVVDDLSEPAFLQPPVPEGTLDDFKADIETPDQLDVLISSKNHEIKSHRFTNPQYEHWIYALTVLQTTEGYLGPGNYGISRMNSGAANRVLTGLTPGLSAGQWFWRDVRMLRANREYIAETYGLDPHGTTLLWLEPWDGTTPIELYDCDPCYIEVCRRIRFQDDMACYRTSSSTYRIHPKSGDINGITGDPWAPIDKEEGKVLNLSGEGFTYRKLQQILLGTNYHRPPALRFQKGEKGTMYLVAKTLVRGQGKTEGLHHRIVPVPAETSGLLRKKNRRQKLAQRARDRVELTDAVQKKVLYPAIAALLGGGSSDAMDFDDVAPWLDAFDRAVDAAFFDALWASAAMDEADALAAWQSFLWDEAQRQFADAEQRAPQSSLRVWRARSTARTIFHGSAKTVLPEAVRATSSATTSS